jgi:hypothetical protein
MAEIESTLSSTSSATRRGSSARHQQLQAAVVAAHSLLTTNKPPPAPTTGKRALLPGVNESKKSLQPTDNLVMQQVRSPSALNQASCTGNVPAAHTNIEWPAVPAGSPDTADTQEVGENPVQQVLESARRLLRLRASTQQAVTAMRVAADEQENARRQREELLRQVCSFGAPHLSL